MRVSDGLCVSMTVRVCLGVRSWCVTPHTATLGVPLTLVPAELQVGSAGERGVHGPGTSLRSFAVTPEAPFIVSSAVSCGSGSQMLC